MERPELSQGKKGQWDPSKKALVGVQGARWFEAKPVLKHLAGSGPEVQKRNFQHGETSRKNQTLEEAQGEVCASYFSRKKALSQRG